MGIVNCSIPTWLALELRNAFHLKTFVETGLGQGTSALWAEQNFDTVISIEIDRGLVDKFRGLCPDSSATIIEGDSGTLLGYVVTTTTMPALFWLDGHTDDYTPIMAELAAINASPLEHVILIDDVRLFGTLKAWPDLEQLEAAAKNMGRRFAMVIDDVLIAMPYTPEHNEILRVVLRAIPKN